VEIKRTHQRKLILEASGEMTGPWKSKTTPPWFVRSGRGADWPEQSRFQLFLKAISVAADRPDMCVMQERIGNAGGGEGGAGHVALSSGEKGNEHG
jgi:hypothetical protein